MQLMEIARSAKPTTFSPVAVGTVGPNVNMFPLLSLDVHKPYMTLESFDNRGFVGKPYIVFTALLSLANSCMQ